LTNLQRYTAEQTKAVAPFLKYIFFKLGDSPMDSLNKTGKLVIVLYLQLIENTVVIWK
tara:strand:- start:11870 stop:12043 length:174 start_codon:yes stop_codon:yes gene_type:complete